MTLYATSVYVCMCMNHSQFCGTGVVTVHGLQTCLCTSLFVFVESIHFYASYTLHIMHFSIALCSPDAAIGCSKAGCMKAL